MEKLRDQRIEKEALYEQIKELRKKLLSLKKPVFNMLKRVE